MNGILTPRLRHTQDPTCPLCEEKLKSAHPFLAYIFHEIKTRHPGVHISWAFRGREDQDRAYAEGKSKVKCPDSPHNAMEKEKPRSQALDLFRLTPEGKAEFPTEWYRHIYQELETKGCPIVWGGTLKRLGDYNYFQLTNAQVFRFIPGSKPNENPPGVA